MNLTDYYEGTVCVVTGATSGNGEALAKKLIKLGAEVHALGRNQTKLSELDQIGCFVHYTELNNHGSISRTLDRLPKRIDYVFHLAGNAVVGEVSPQKLDDFWESDYRGPTQLLAHLVPRMHKEGGAVGIVTSASCAMGDIKEVRHYQSVKREMVKWWWGNQRWAENFNTSLTLISMGAISTSIWSRAEGMSTVTAGLVSMVIPGAEHYTKQILEDVALKKLVSYPGVGASWAPVVDGEYCPRPMIKNMSTAFTKAWFNLFPPNV